MCECSTTFTATMVDFHRALNTFPYPAEHMQRSLNLATSHRLCADTEMRIHMKASRDHSRPDIAVLCLLSHPNLLQRQRPISAHSLPKCL